MDFKDWSSWIMEGHFISYIREGIRYYEHVILRDLGHWEYTWPESITTITESGPYTPADLEITKGYDAGSNTNHIWQVLFGMNKQVYVYIELPTDIHRHGIPKQPKPGTDLRETSHFNEWMSPWHEPSFLTEHWMLRPENSQMAISAYNYQATNIAGFKLNFIISKLVTERIGTEGYSDDGILELKPSKQRWADILDKLFKRTVPQRPLTLLGVRAPAEAPSGH